MGIKNYLIEGVSCTGKTTVSKELAQRGFHAINADRELAYQGDPLTGERTIGVSHQHHIWDVNKVKAIINNNDEEMTFFCGGSRNFYQFIDLFDEVFILDIDVNTLKERLNLRPQGEWGSKKEEQDLILHLHQTKEDLPINGIIIDATESIEKVVDKILNYCDKPNQ